MYTSFTIEEAKTAVAAFRKRKPDDPRRLRCTAVCDDLDQRTKQAQKVWDDYRGKTGVRYARRVMNEIISLMVGLSALRKCLYGNTPPDENPAP